MENEPLQDYGNIPNLAHPIAPFLTSESYFFQLPLNISVHLILILHANLEQLF